MSARVGGKQQICPFPASGGRTGRPHYPQPPGLGVKETLHCSQATSAGVQSVCGQTAYCGTVWPQDCQQDLKKSPTPGLAAGLFGSPPAGLGTVLCLHCGCRRQPVCPLDPPDLQVGRQSWQSGDCSGPLCQGRASYPTANCVRGDGESLSAKGGSGGGLRARSGHQARCPIWP